MTDKGLKEVIAEIKQRVVATSAKSRRSEARTAVCRKQNVPDKPGTVA